MKYNEIVERHAPRLGLNNLVTGEPCKPFVYMDYVDDGMWVHYVTYCENIRRQKRKRCLALAEMCEEKCYYFNERDEHIGLTIDEGRRWSLFDRWRVRWGKLADKFKEGA